MPRDVDYEKLGARIRNLRFEKGLTQGQLAEMTGCSNNYLSHIETAQCKLSLSMLLKLSYALCKGPDFFLLDTPYAPKEVLIRKDIASKLRNCSSSTLNAVSKSIDVLLDLQSELTEK